MSEAETAPVAPVEEEKPAPVEEVETPVEPAAAAAAPVEEKKEEAEEPKKVADGEAAKKDEDEHDTEGTFNKINRLLDTAASYLPEPLHNVYKKLDPVLDQILYAFIFVFPYLEKAVDYICDVYMKLPPHTVPMIYGLLVCFMGAHFCCLVAVIEAFKISGGGKKMKNFILLLWESFKNVNEASERDDKVDADNDGVADVEQISDGELFIRKVKLVLRELDPLAVNKALTGLYQCMLSAVCVVQFEFAKTITLGNSIGEFLFVTVDGLCRPFFEYVLADYAKWVSLAIRYTCKALGSTIAWIAQFYASLFHCAISGALTFSRALIAFLNDRKITNIDTNESWLDEITGWILAAVSILFQAVFGTNLIFPFNIILLPFRGIEAFLKASASSDAFGTAANTGAAAVPAQ